ncbi:MAG TPA: NAD(P)-dependent oxidoreductase [Pseudomonadales bacterium]|nr:NAD(P)-dependent oxidoreductase [Pseudomonadales bacterium]
MTPDSSPRIPATSIGWIGLGTMGGPMAGHLVRAGHTVQAYNRNPQRAAKWLQDYPAAKTVASCADAARGATFVFSCVGGDNDVREVALAAFAVMKTGSVFVDHSTTSATVARELAQAAEKHGVYFIDAPVSGGQAGAEKGQLAVMAGGTVEAFARAEPVMAAYSKRSKRIGDVGSGQLTKMVNQICFIGVVEGLAEGLFFAEQAGLDTTAVLDVISQGAAGSWQMDNRAHTMLQGRYDFGFAVDLVRKDLGILLEQARNMHCELPATEMINRFYAELQAMGHGRSDTSSLMERLRLQRQSQR